VTAEALIAFVGERIAHYKAPREVVFAEIPRTSTGKVQKHVLRRLARGEATPGDPGWASAVLAWAAPA